MTNATVAIDRFELIRKNAHCVETKHVGVVQTKPACLAIMFCGEREPKRQTNKVKKTGLISNVYKRVQTQNAKLNLASNRRHQSKTSHVATARHTVRDLGARRNPSAFQIETNL